MYGLKPVPSKLKSVPFTETQFSTQTLTHERLR